MDFKGMILIKQNNDWLSDSIRKWGCKFRCLQAIAEITTGRALELEDIEALYKDIINLNDCLIMNNNCRCGEDEHLIVNKTFEYITKNKYYTARQMGSMVNGIPTGWSNKRLVKYNFIMVKWAVNLKKNEYHFTLNNEKNEEVFDPWDSSKGILEKVDKEKELIYAVSNFELQVKTKKMLKLRQERRK